MPNSIARPYCGPGSSVKARLDIRAQCPERSTIAPQDTHDGDDDRRADGARPRDPRGAGARPTRRGPGPVAVVHRIFIVSALLCALVYAAWELREYGRTGEVLAVVRGAVALLVGVGTAVYLRSLRTLGARLTARREPP